MIFILYIVTCVLVTLLFFICLLDLAPQALAQAGQKACPSGREMIMDTTECWNACNELNVFVLINPKSDQPCYMAGNGYQCKKDGRHGNAASLICKLSGISQSIFLVRYAIIVYITTNTLSM